MFSVMPATDSQHKTIHLAYQADDGVDRDTKCDTDK